MFAFLALLTATAPAAGHPPPEQAAVRLSPVQLFEFAERLRSGGRVEDAERAYRALATNPDKDIRSEARFRLARMLAAHDRSSEAAILLRQVLDERPGAQRVRIELATLLARMGQVAAAQKELRAAQAGSLPSDVARLVDRFSGALRARSPHGVSVTFAVAPDTNINRGTQLDRLGTVLGDFIIDREAKRRSGVGFQIDAEAFVRRRVNDHPNFLVKGVAAARLYA